MVSGYIGFKVEVVNLLEGFINLPLKLISNPQPLNPIDQMQLLQRLAVSSCSKHPLNLHLQFLNLLLYALTVRLQEMTQQLL